MPNYVDDHQSKIHRALNHSPLVTTPAALEKARATLASESLIAVDTESDSLYSYFEKVCLIQFSTRTVDYVIDPLAFSKKVEPLRPIFADASIEKVFHAAEYDIFCMKRDYQFTFANLFDTMIAARILGWKNVGLGNILQERFDIVLNKKMQRADWGQRPLTDEHVEYAREDTHYLLALRDLQIQELERTERIEEAREEFERLTHIEPMPRRFDPDAYWNINGARDLDKIGLGVLRELYRWRESQARREDRPPFKIISDSTMLRLADARPSSIRDMDNMAGISSYLLQRYSRAILEAVAQGRASPQLTQPKPQARADSPLDNHARDRMGKLKEWRKQAAIERGVESDVIVSNDVLITLARKNPRTLESLIAASGLGPHKSKLYAEQLLQVLHPK